MKYDMPDDWRDRVSPWWIAGYSQARSLELDPIEQQIYERGAAARAEADASVRGASTRCRVLMVDDHGRVDYQLFRPSEMLQLANCTAEGVIEIADARVLLSVPNPHIEYMQAELLAMAWDAAWFPAIAANTSRTRNRLMPTRTGGSLGATTTRLERSPSRPFARHH
jgi:hypothetical protein